MTRLGESEHASKLKGPIPVSNIATIPYILELLENVANSPTS